METNNERLKLILHDAKLICLSKFQIVQSVHGTSNSELKKLKKEMDTAIQRYDNPTLWLYPIPFDEVATTLHVVQIDSCPTNNLETYAQVVRDFIQFLIKIVADIPVAEASMSETSDFNLKVLNVLTQVQRNVGGRKVYFKNNQNVDLDKDPKFVPMQEEQRPIQTDYRKALTENAVAATESDVLIFNRISENIRQSTVLDKFFMLYQMHTDTMKAKLPADESNPNLLEQAVRAFSSQIPFRLRQIPYTVNR